MKYASKLPQEGTTIFTVISAAAQACNAINLSQGFPDYPADPRLLEWVSHYLQKGYNQYAPMAGAMDLRESIADAFYLKYQWRPDPQSEITITAGATQALFTAINTFALPGDEVIIIEPAFDSYRPAILASNAKVVPIPTLGPAFEVDWNRVKDQITARTKMIIINTPNNPTGKVLRKEDFLRLADIVQDRGIIVLSDEVYEHITFDGFTHLSAMAIDALRSQTLSVFSFGKTFHVTGWKVGYIIGPEHLVSEFRKVHQYTVFVVAHPLQMALAAYMKDPQTYLSLPDFFTPKRNVLYQYLHDSDFIPEQTEGTYFMVADYSQISKQPDRDFVDRYMRDVGVAMIPLSAFYSEPPDQHFVRFCFAKKDETLQRAGELLTSK